jgi:hypothetical protein
MSPRTADLIRKTLAGALSILITVLLFRVMFRAANGDASLADPELWIALVLLLLGVAWVRTARRVRGDPVDPGDPKVLPRPKRVCAIPERHRLAVACDRSRSGQPGPAAIHRDRRAGWAAEGR